MFEVDGILLRPGVTEKPKLNCHLHLSTHEIFNPTAYYIFEKGMSSEDERLEGICESFNLSDDEARALMRSTRPTIPASETLELVNSLQKDHKVYGVGNLPAPVYQLLRAECKVLDSLDNVLLSSEIGERMPHLGFFNAVRDIEPLSVERTLFVCSNLDIVVALSATTQ